MQIADPATVFYLEIAPIKTVVMAQISKDINTRGMRNEDFESN